MIANADIFHEWFGLQDKTAIVVGASQGLGKEIAIAFAKAGANVVCVSRNKEKLEKTADAIRQMNRSSFAISADVTREKDIKRAVAETLERLTSIDILAYSAGYLKPKHLVETNLQEWQKTIDTNLTGAFLISREVAKHMQIKGNGRIILIGSIFGDRILPYVLSYAVSKGGILQLVRNLAYELAPHGIRVNGIAPGYFNTEMPAEALNNPKLKEKIIKRIPLKRVGNPLEIGPLAVYLASKSSDFICGEVIRIDGGQSFNIA